MIRDPELLLVIKLYYANSHSSEVLTIMYLHEKDTKK